MNLADIAASDLADAYKKLTLSPVEVLDAVLARIAICEPHLNALWMIDSDGAYAAARSSEQRWHNGTSIGPLDGVPITIKENIATKGVALPIGTAATTLVPAAEDAPQAARVREAGAVIFAKTTMPDFGMLSSSLSSFHELSRNPWDVTKTPGGSSSGAGAAAAAGYGPLHLGTDIGGSVRLPAGWCGVFALKPSLGRIPIDPPFQGRVTGPMTRSVKDSALLMSVLSQFDARDHMALPPESIDWLDLDIDIKGLKIGLWIDAGLGLPVEPEVRDAIEAAAKAYADAGAHVDIIKPFVTRDMFNGQDRFWRARALHDMMPLSSERKAMILPFIRDWAEGAAGYSGQDVYSGYHQSMLLRKITNDACRNYDFILSPTAPVPAFAAELPCPTNDATRPFEHIAFTLPFNISEQPAASINCGMTQTGLPIGLQIAGRRFDDLGVMRMAYAWERMRPRQAAWPVFA